MLFLFYILFSTQPAHSNGGNDPFREAVQSYIDIRALEEELRLAPFQNTEEQANFSKKLEQQLTQKRIEFNALLRNDKNEYLPWQQTVFDNKKKVTKNVQPEVIEYLVSAFPESKQFSPLEWKSFSELFGVGNQEAFLRISLSIQELPGNTPSISNGKRGTLLVVVDPFGKILKKTKDKTEISLIKELKKKGEPVELLHLSAFSKVEDQADELYRILSERSSDPIILFSNQEASAILLHCLDLHPDLRNSEKILGWINLDGKLYGAAPPKEKSRGLASVSEKNPVEKLEYEANQELHLLYKESLSRAAPLGKGFPILNIISKADNQHNLSESIVPGARTFSIPKNRSVMDAIPILRSPASSE